MMIKIICANDSLELAFLPGTPDEVIEKEMQRIKAKYLKSCPPAFPGLLPPVYVHLHEVEVFNA